MKTLAHEMAERLFKELWVERKLETIDELFAEDFQVFHPSAPDLAEGGLSDLKKGVNIIFNAFHDVMFEVDDIIAEDDKAVVRWHATGTHTGKFGKIEATHTIVTYAGIVIIEVEVDKIINAWVADNTATLFN